jgi:hypothetical protein
VIPLQVNQHKNLTDMTASGQCHDSLRNTKLVFIFAVVATSVCMQLYLPSATVPPGLPQFKVHPVAI